MNYFEVFKFAWKGIRVTVFLSKKKDVNVISKVILTNSFAFHYLNIKKRLN